MSSWAFGFRVWVAVLVALAVSFWLELGAPSTAALTVTVLASPTRGQAWEKACYRLVATIIGVAAAVTIVGLFSQTRDLLLAACAAWLGLSVYAAGLLDGNRASAAVLSGYTVTIIAIQQLDTPQHTFDSVVSRGGAIGVGIVAIAVVNDLLGTPDSLSQLAAKLAALHGRVREYAKAAIRDDRVDDTTAVDLLRDIAELRSDMTGLASESPSGLNRRAAACSTAVALLAELHAARALNALSIAAEPPLREWTASILSDWREDSPPAGMSLRRGSDATSGDSMAVSLAWILSEYLRRDGEVVEGLAALTTGGRPQHAWRTPIYRSHQIAAEAGILSTVRVTLASIVFVLAGWPATDVSLSLAAVVIALSATTPNPYQFTALALVGAPIAAVSGGMLEFVILAGADEFPLLAIALAPFMIVAAAMMTWSNRVLSALGRFNLSFVLVLFSPSNPQSYNPQAFLFTSSYLCLATAVLLAAELLIPPASSKRHEIWLIASARRELDGLLRRGDRSPPEEAMFRDATRIGQMARATSVGPGQPALLAEALACFDQAAAIRMCDVSLTPLAESPLAHLAGEAKKSLSTGDTQGLRGVARRLLDGVPSESAPIGAIGALTLAGIVMDRAKKASEPALEKGV